MRIFFVFAAAFFLMAGCNKKEKEENVTGKAKPVYAKSQQSQTKDKSKTKKEAVKKEKKIKEKKVISVLKFGRWYPASKDNLLRTINSYINEAKISPIPQVIGLIVPHAGYQYSGRTAAYGFKAVLGKKYKRVIVLGPSHHVFLKNTLVVPDATHYKTPLGEVEIDVDFINKLVKSGIFVKNSKPFLNEHSVDNEIPFIQRVITGFKLVPIIVGYLDKATIKKAATVLKKLVDNDTLVVVSSDFTHYGKPYNYVPFTDNIEENLRKLDFKAASLIEEVNFEKFYRFKQETGDTICGFMPISILLEMLPHTAKPRVVKYDTSGKLTGRFDYSVSYFAIVITGKWKMEKVNAPRGWKLKDITDSEKKALLKLSRYVLEKYVREHKIPTPEEAGVKITDMLKEKSGAFVTLTKKGMLRGCIGEIPPRRPVYQVVIDHTIDAAVHDPRFKPVTPDELKDITIEISILTPPMKVNSYKDIVIGKHGIVIRKNGHSAVYLPQVAPEQGWDLPTTLSYLSRKAGLPMDAWKSGATFYVFEAIVFSEKDFK